MVYADSVVARREVVNVLIDYVQDVRNEGGGQAYFGDLAMGLQATLCQTLVAVGHTTRTRSRLNYFDRVGVGVQACHVFVRLGVVVGGIAKGLFRSAVVPQVERYCVMANCATAATGTRISTVIDYRVFR